jgi:hypothetical protein
MQMGLLARTPAGRDMAVSSGSDDDDEAGARSPRKGGSSKKKKKQKKGKHMTEEEMEAMQGAKGARKAREWLDSGFGGYKAVSACHRHAICLCLLSPPACLVGAELAVAMLGECWGLGQVHDDSSFLAPCVWWLHSLFWCVSAAVWFRDSAACVMPSKL